MDRVKAAIFSSLGEKVIGARVLDLFAGAGGLGIEAMSRGAASAVFVESNRNAARAIERNLAITAVNGRVRMRDAFDYLKYATGHFDIILADPPYEAAPGDKAYHRFAVKSSENTGPPRSAWSIRSRKTTGRASAASFALENSASASLRSDRDNFRGTSKMIRLIYNLLWPVGLLLFLPGYLAKMFRRGGYRRNFGQRLGFYSSECRERLRGKASDVDSCGQRR